MTCRYFSNFSQATATTKVLDNGPSQHERPTMRSTDSSLARLLFSNGPASDRAEKMGLYGWLVGDWTMDAIMHAPDGGTHERRGEISFAWVLEGRAIQDVWVLPDFFYGTTLRVYDPGIDAWHILWSDPLRQILRPPDRPSTRSRHRPTGEVRRWQRYALELYRHHP